MCKHGGHDQEPLLEDKKGGGVAAKSHRHSSPTALIVVAMLIVTINRGGERYTTGAGINRWRWKALTRKK